MNYVKCHEKNMQLGAITKALHVQSTEKVSLIDCHFSYNMKNDWGRVEVQNIPGKGNSRCEDLAGGSGKWEQLKENCGQERAKGRGVSGEIMEVSGGCYVRQDFLGNFGLCMASGQ